MLEVQTIVDRAAERGQPPFRACWVLHPPRRRWIPRDAKNYLVFGPVCQPRIIGRSRNSHPKIFGPAVMNVFAHGIWTIGGSSRADR